MQPETLHSRWAGTPLLAWARGMGKPNTRAGKTPHLRFQIRQICTLSSSLGQSASPAWSHRWVSVRITPWALKVETRPTKICVLLVAGSYPISVSQMPSDGAPQIPLQFLWCKIIVGGPIKQPKMLGDGWWSPWILFSHWRKQRLRRDLSAWCCADLLLPSDQSVLVSVHRGALASLHVLEFSQWCPWIGIRETGVGNYLCCHPGGTDSVFFWLMNELKEDILTKLPKL